MVLTLNVFSVFIKIRSRQSKIYEFQSFERWNVLVFTNTNVIRFQVVINETNGMKLFKECYKLYPYQIYRFKTKFISIDHLIKFQRFSKTFQYLIVLVVFETNSQQFWKVGISFIVQHSYDISFNLIHLWFIIDFTNDGFIVIVHVDCFVACSERPFC